MVFYLLKEVTALEELLLGASRLKLSFILFSLGVFGATAFAHEGKSHKIIGANQPPASTIPDERLKTINETYLKLVKPIFQKSCFDCHSQNPSLPWYYKIPLAHELMEGDMKEAKEHLDMTRDFPFQGHGSPLEDLKAMRKTIEDQIMPPFRYRIMHSRSGLTDEERRTVLMWIDESEKTLMNDKP